MINPTDESFIKELKPFLKGFKKSNHNYNFRCPFCGDSAKSQSKQRGWLIDYKGNTFFKCFNCGLSCNFAKFIKHIDESLYSKYVLFKNSNNNHKEPIKEEKKVNLDYISKEMFESNPYVQSCSKSNPGRQYLVGRKLTHPELFYFTLDYGSLLKSLNLKDYEVEWSEHKPRLILPHWSRDNKLNFLQFRDLDPHNLIRYKTYRIREDASKIWGLERIDFNKRILICEGALDASLLDNCLAMSGSDTNLNGNIINNYKENLFFILDNEPYNKQICDKYRKLCELGYNVYIWPNVKAKDINDYYKEVGNVDIFYDKSRFYKGLKLKLELSRWTKS